MEFGKSRIERRKDSIFSGDADYLESLIKELNQSDQFISEEGKNLIKDSKMHLDKTENVAAKD
jgi:hypothetical protein